MTLEQLKDLIEVYREGLSSIEPIAMDHTKKFPTQKEGLQHAAYMVSEMHDWFDAGILIWEESKIEKAMRWLGFLQGILWTHGIYSIEDMKKHNR